MILVAILASLAQMQESTLDLPKTRKASFKGLPFGRAEDNLDPNEVI